MTVRRKWLPLLALAALALVLGYRHFRARPHDDDGAPRAVTTATSAAPAVPRRFGRVAFQPCTLAASFGGSVEAQCGTFEVAENPAAPRGRRIKLALAWIPADDTGEHAPDPVFLLAGGPGQSAKDSYPAVAAAFAETLKHRDVVLVDQRGTGGSNPLTCGGLDEADRGDDAAAAMATRCRDALARRADLRFYTTTDAVRDLDAVRAALGLERINLLGVSYGTRVAQQYAGRHPQHTRALVLDSVAPNTVFLGNDFARNLEAALDLQFGRCGREPACARTLGQPRDQLNALMAKLRTDPPRVRYRDAGTGAWHKDTLTTGHVAALTRMYAYSPSAASVLPLVLAEGAQGRYEGLMALSKMLVGDLSEQMAFGMQLSVICSEDADGLRADPAMADSVLGNGLVTALLAQCAVWPKGARPADFHAPLTSSVPALLLAGELDPVTPPAYARDAAKTLRNGRVLVLRGQGHNVIGAGCMPKLLARFLDDPDARALDARCLDSLAGTPPFTTFNGWSP